MDNAIEALKIAFAVCVFVISLSMSMSVFSQAKEVSDEVFYMTDKTNSYELTSSENLNPKGREVSAETIIPTLYRYYKENFIVIIKDKAGRELVRFDLEKEIKDYSKDYRQAPWLGNANEDTKKRVDIEISGDEGYINGVLWEPTVSGGLLAYLTKAENGKNKKFLETFIETKISGKEITVNDEGELVLVDEATDENGNTVYTKTFLDNETLEVVKGSTKIQITYQEL